MGSAPKEIVMLCECGERMVCNFTRPFSKTGRYRTYQCKPCKKFVETVETDVLKYPPTAEQVQVVMAGIAKARTDRFMFARRTKKGATVAGAVGESVASLA